MNKGVLFRKIIDINSTFPKLRESLIIDFFQKTKITDKIQGIFFWNSLSYFIKI